MTVQLRSRDHASPFRTTSRVRLVASLAAALFLLVAGSDARAGDPVEISGVSFIDRVATGEISSLPTTTYGLGVLDYDGDGWLDLVLGGEEDSQQYLVRNIPDPTRPGERTFEDVTVGSGLDDADGTARSQFGYAIADIDNDGDPDIYTLGHESEDDSIGLLYRNDGGTFTNVSIAAGLRDSGVTPECAAFNDYDHDGDPDLIVANVSGARSFYFYENQGNGSFVARHDRTPDLGNFQAAYAMTFSDYDLDGWMDCFVIVWGNPPTLLRNQPDGTGGRIFVNVAGDAGFVGLGFAPMGITSGDWDGDGDIDYAISNGASGRYFENQGNGTFVRITPINSIFGWGNALLDAENDGDLDYYMAGSWGGAAVDVLYLNRLNEASSDWTDISEALNGVAASGRFSVQVDYDNDGLVDIITMNPDDLNQPYSIYNNVATSGHHWIKLDLNGDGTFVNRDAVGAFVRIVAGGQSQVAEVNRLGSSTASTEDLRLNFGLGSTTTVDRIDVLWPRKGNLQSRLDVFHGPFAADQILTIEPRSIIERCGDGSVDLASGSVADVLELNGSTGGATREVVVTAGTSLTASLENPPQGGNGRFVAHATIGAPSYTSRSVLPASIGTSCFPFLLNEGASPDAIWNNIGRTSQVGESRYFDGSPIPDPNAAPVDFLDLPSGDVVNLPMGTTVTFQAVIRDNGSTSPKGASVTNAVILHVQ